MPSRQRPARHNSTDQGTARRGAPDQGPWRAGGDVFLGLDLGTSAVKACAVDGAGRLVAWSEERYPTASPQPGWAEQEPAAWTQAAVGALRRVAACVGETARPRALALAGQLPTLALLDDAGRPLRPAIVWYDGRAEEQAAALLRVVEAGEWYRRSGVVLDAHYLAPMHLWVAQHEPSLLGRGYHLCSAKDALLHALTGAWLTDPTTASGYGVYAPQRGSWDTGLCAAAGIDPALLPGLAPPWSVAGPLGVMARDAGLPLGLPVVVGAADSLAGVLGCGGAGPGILSAITGTSTALLVTTQEPRLDPARRFFLTPHVLPHMWGLEMDLMATGAALGWLAGLLGLAHAGEVYGLAASSPPGARGVVALPYLAGGEQGALWDAGARGAFVGLSPAHGPADLARALVEGIAFEMRRCTVAWEDAGVTVREVVLAGAEGTGDFAPLLAAVLARPVHLATSGPASAVGAALLAGLGVGAWEAKTITAMARAALRDPIAPAPGAAARYAVLYDRYDRVSGALREYMGTEQSVGPAERPE